MKNVSSNFKSAIKTLGRQLNTKITYTESSQTKIISNDELYSATLITHGNLLKSVMKEFDFESSVKVEKDTEIAVQFGVLVNGSFEYENFGNFIVAEEPEYNADTLSYTHKCFDKMIYTMADYESLNVTYPITIKNYLVALATKIGLTLKSASFYNENQTIQNELYLDVDGNSLGYTYRDVLDELAQATGSIICINDDDEIEVRYLNNTNETIDGDMLKNVNVAFKEQYGAINVVVLSRSAGVDNIYYPSTLPQNPIEIKIQDNQILNGNNRSDFIEGIYNALNGISYYINDFSSIGITYLEIGDKYNVSIDGVTYNCVLLNNEINIKQGLEEQIYTEMPEQGETDYTKADKTDRKINQTNLIVDKQNQKIEGIISQIGDRSQKTTTITADIDGINSRVEDIEDITNTVESTTGSYTINDNMAGDLIELHIFGDNNVFGNSSSILRVINWPLGWDTIEHYRIYTTTDYDLSVTEVLRANGDTKDEYILKDNKAKVIRRINSDGTIKQEEDIEDLGELSIPLKEICNRIGVYNYTATFKFTYALKNDFTDVFSTRVDMKSSITQTANEINLKVEEKLDEEDFTGANIMLAVNNDQSSAQINADKISLSGKTINLTSDTIAISSTNFNVDANGNVSANSFSSTNANITGGKFNVSGSGSATDLINVKNASNSSQFTYIQPVGAGFVNGNSRIDIYTAGQTVSSGTFCAIDISDDEGYTVVRGAKVTTPQVIQTSLESQKKNFEIFQNALDTIKNIDIYKYNLKNEEDGTKKHIGFVIGDNYKYSEEITSKDNDGADIYSFVSLCCQAIKELEQEVQNLKDKLNKN